MKRASIVLVGMFAMWHTLVCGQESSTNSDSYGFSASFPEIHSASDVVFYKTEGKNGQIDPHAIYFNISSQLDRDLTAMGEFEIEHGNELKLTRMFADWRIHKAMALMFGVNMAPFGLLDRVYYAPLDLRKFRKHPRAIRKIVPAGWRQTGFFVHGVISIKDSVGMQLKYDVSLSTGLGATAFNDVRKSRQYRDNNNNKTLTARLSYCLSKELEIGGSYSYGLYDDLDQDAISIIGGHFIFQKTNYSLLGEYISSTVEDSTATLIRSGFYIASGYKLFTGKKWKKLKYLEPVVRLELFNPNEAIKDQSDQTKVSLGVIVAPHEHFKFRLEYHIVNEQHGAKIANDEFSIQAVIDF